MTDAAQPYRYPGESDNDWQLRLSQEIADRNTLFDIQLSQGDPGALAEVTAAAVDAAALDAIFPPDPSDLPPSVKELAVDYVTIVARAEADRMRLIAGDADAVARFLNFEETLHIMDIADNSPHRPPTN